MAVKPVRLADGLEIPARDDLVPAWVRWDFEPSVKAIVRPSGLTVHDEGKEWPFILEGFRLFQIEGQFRWWGAPNTPPLVEIPLVLPFLRPGGIFELVFPFVAQRREEFEAVELYLFEQLTYPASIYGFGLMATASP